MTHSQNEWRNWSGSVSAHPRRVASPRTEQQLLELIDTATTARVVGAGHSFMPLCASDDLLLDLSAMDGTIVVAPDRRTVDAPAGMSLRQLTAELWTLGLSLPNQGDVNPQALAGALATGTHGTGRQLGSLSTFAVGFRVMLASGEVVECSRNERADLFEATRLAMGTTGIILRARITVMPAFYLEERISKAPLTEVLERFDDLSAAHRHVEFFLFPYADHVILKTLDPVEGGASMGGGGDGEAIFKMACRIARLIPAAIPPIHRTLTRAVGTSQRAGPAYRIFPSDRTTRFEEMEYEVPVEAGPSALRETVDRIRKDRMPLAFPIEYRSVAGDDIWLSPFDGGGARAALSFHQYAPMDWRPPFARLEPILRAHGGRPHWAKRHTLGRDDVTALYPRADDFRRVRAAHDPSGKFLNPHLAELLS